MSDQVLGYTARKNKDGSKTYVEVFVLSEIEAKDGRGAKATQLPASEALEPTLRGLTYPAAVNLTYAFGTVRTEYGDRPTVTITGVEVVRRAAA